MYYIIYIMSNLKFKPDVKKNKKGKVIENILNVMPKKGYVSIQEVQKVYKEIVKKSDPGKVMIKIITHDTMLTAKSFENTDDELEIVLENYYNGLSSESKTKFKQLLGFQIITR